MPQTDPIALAVLDQLPDFILVVNPKGNIQWASPSAHRDGLTSGTGDETSLAALFHPEDADRVSAGLDEALSDPGRTVHVDALALLPSRGDLRAVEATLRYVPEPLGGVLAILREIVQRHAQTPPRPYDRRLSRKPSGQVPRDGESESEEQLRQVVRLSHIGIWDHDHLTGELYWSPEHRKIFGWDADEPVVFSNPAGTSWETWNLIHPLDRQRAAEGVKRAHRPDGDGRFDLEYRIVRRDGSLRWIATRSQTFFEGEGPARRAVRTVGAVQDITAQKLAERQLRLTQTSVDRCNTAIYWVNEAGRITYANECACQNLGLTREELIGRYVWDFDADVTAADWPALWERARWEKSISVATRHRRKDGTLFPVEAVGSYQMIDGEEHLFVFVQDTTERQRAERERQLMHTAIEKSHTSFYAIGPTGRIIYANERACRMLGLTRESLVGRPLCEIDPSVRPELQDEYWHTMKEKGMLRFETTHRRADGTFIPVEVTTNFVTFKDEEFTLAFASDLTERNRAELALRRSEERLRQAVLIFDIGIFEHDHATDTVYCSPELRRYLDLPLDEDVVPVPLFRRCVHPEDWMRTRGAIARAHDPRGDGRYSNTFRVIHSDGSIRWLETRSQTFFEGEGPARRAVRTVGAIADITERRRVNEALKASLREKETLLREVHHRVKNNLQIIASLLNLQMRGIRDGAARDAMMTVRSRVNALALIHRTLYETDEMQQVELGGFLRALAEQVSDFLDASERHIDVRVAVPTVLVPAETAVTVALLVTEALTNAFKHAFPYRRDGHVTIRMEPSPNGTAILSIADDGVGGVRHSPDDQQDLSDRSLGNQLMLGYARQLGGVLAIDDSGGTIIRVELPAIPLTASPEEPASPVREAASD